MKQSRLIFCALYALCGSLASEDAPKPPPAPLTTKQMAEYRLAREPEVAKEGKWLFMTVRK